MSETHEQLAVLLQASRDFAFAQMARGARLIPFAGRVKPDGEIEFVRFVEEHSDLPLDEIYTGTQAVIAEQAVRGELLAASLTAAVRLDEPEQGFDTALRVHVEAPGYCRQVLVPYALEPAEADAEKGTLRVGQLVPYEATPAIFAG